MTRVPNVKRCKNARILENPRHFNLVVFNNGEPPYNRYVIDLFETLLNDVSSTLRLQGRNEDYIEDFRKDLAYLANAPRTKNLFRVTPRKHGSTRFSEDQPFPEVAPAVWKFDKKEGQTPPEFIQEHYKPWLDGRLARGDLMHLDMSLYNALAHWLRKNELPKDLNLPSQREKTDRWLDRVRVGAEPLTDQQAMQRAASALRRRRHADGDTDKEADEPTVQRVSQR